MLGCPYGLGSVVVTFNRYPTLVVAAQRRILGLLSGAYFDDILTMDISATSRQAKELGNWLWSVLDTPPKPPKAFTMQSHRPFLGSVPDLSSLTIDGGVTITPRESSRRHVRDDIEAALSSGVFTSAQASKTRGRSGWVATNSFGRIGRLGTAVLKELQYCHRGQLLPRHKQALAFHSDLIMALPPRQVQVVRRGQRRVVILYSDAEYSPNSGLPPKLGWVLFPGIPWAPQGRTLVLGPDIVDIWKVRTQQIYPAEAVAVPLATWHDSAWIRGRDVIWFIDNESAASSCIRGSSAEPDVDTMVQTAHLLWCDFNCHLCIGGVDSASNLADG